LLDASFSMSPVSYEGKQAISSSQNFLLYKQKDAHLQTKQRRQKHIHGQTSIQGGTRTVEMPFGGATRWP
jgi:hypothetical protein